ncbi:D-alanine--D-alanine ligase family protein [Prochlorococcus marinus]|uniref:D-alanine--D-alanine ligase family protein n=1 Tax=Prochlorococcus marinus TaxID=1219 RepID=UPI0022B591D9|nr:D-alanine--D-alanine ligase family protein [Prochlorococcus marinus]
MKNKVTNVGIVFGGVSGEHEVSINSAKTILTALRETSNSKKYKGTPFYIDKQGKWLQGEAAENILHADSIPNTTNNKLNSSIGLNCFPEEIEKIDIWFPVLHGPNCEDGTIQGLFKLTGKPFVGSGVLGSALGMDKIAMKNIFSSVGLPQVSYCEVYKKDLLDKKNLILLIEKIELNLGYPCFIKPANLGSSVGISKAYNKEDLLQGIKIASKLDNRVVVEKGITARELECGVLGKKEMITSCVGEVRYKSDWYDYSTKYSEKSNEILIPAPISIELSNKIKKLALYACNAIAVEGIARVDFFYEENTCNLLINEINTLPGFTSQSMYPMLWAASGINLSKLVSRLIESAKE